jgi:hypothetical protein
LKDSQAVELVQWNMLITRTKIYEICIFSVHPPVRRGTGFIYCVLFVYLSLLFCSYFVVLCFFMFCSFLLL